LSFFNDLHQKLGAPGDFAQAYVLTHEIGHHVQNLFGIAEKVQQQRMRVSETEANARRLALGPTQAFGEIKRLVNESPDQTLAAQLEAEIEAFARCAGTRDFAEGVTAFVEKRKPNFKGN